MNWTQLNKWFVVLAMCTSSLLYAEEEAVKEGFLPTEALHADWVFSGVVTNESGENYGYYFQMQRNEDKFHVITSLFDAQNKKVLLQDDSSANLAEPNNYNWKVGSSFLRFNPINASWIFGMKTKDKHGFNFKIDMLNQNEKKPVIQNLRSGMELIIEQTGSLNGHVRGEENTEQFVTAKSAWFRQVSLNGMQAAEHPFAGILCRFNDGSGFYSVNMKEADAIKGAVTGAYDDHGKTMVMSQFININADKTGQWHIRSTPNFHWILKDTVKQSSVTSGFVNKKEKLGFCMLSEDTLGKQKNPIA